ncbi:hypothetical protein HHX48_08455 [Salinimonas sp. HHU 13199]|uniref:RDD domain-containing protein n=1 Tax=Salinimonas profundi TaxID=2729140 RepID=A0ABR8LMY6_9ALTE|nr:hypothetical protein [Salinimonas profundi]MBD3585762.1 hypothetical protein [Salinimonas profundi]
MNEFDKDLGELWQSQPVSAIDIKKVKQRWRTFQLRHRLYLALDCFCLVPLIYLLFWSPIKTNSPQWYFLIAIGFAAVTYTGYLTWLRRLSLFSGKSTRDHLDLLRRQLANNVRIAQVSKHSAWVTQLALTAFFATLYLSGGLPASKLSSVSLAIGGAGIANLLFYLWAARRQRRFAREYAQLVTQLEASEPAQ